MELMVDGNGWILQLQIAQGLRSFMVLGRHVLRAVSFLLAPFEHVIQRRYQFNGECMSR